MPCPAKKGVSFSHARNTQTKRAEASGGRGEVRASRRASSGAGKHCLSAAAPARWASQRHGLPPTLAWAPPAVLRPAPDRPGPCALSHATTTSRASTGYLQQVLREGTGTGSEASAVPGALALSPAHSSKAAAVHDCSTPTSQGTPQRHPSKRKTRALLELARRACELAGALGQTHGHRARVAAEEE